MKYILYLYRVIKKQLEIMRDLRETKLWVILNEETLETMKDEKGNVQKFETEMDADLEAAGRLEIWVPVRVHFNHRFIQHKL